MLGVVERGISERRSGSKFGAICGAFLRPPCACWSPWALVLALNWSGARLSIHAIQVLGEDMSLVEQAIARLKNQQGGAAKSSRHACAAQIRHRPRWSSTLNDTATPRNG